MRVFVALEIDHGIRERIQRFIEGVQEFAPDARWVRSESLHITLKFIGERSIQSVDLINNALSAVRGPSFDLILRGYGFFPSPKSARVFWIGISAGPELAALARHVDEATATAGIPREAHQYTPHLTLARAGSGAPRRQSNDSRNLRFQKLQARLSAFPKPVFGSMTAREFFLYESKLGRGGSVYSKIAGFTLE